MGCGPASCGAVSWLAFQRAARRFRNLTLIPPAGALCNWPAAGKFPVAAGFRLGDFRRFGPCPWHGGRGLSGPLARQADPRILSDHFQHACFLAGAAAAFDLFRMAGMASHRPVRANRRGGKRCHLGGPAAARYPSRPGLERYRGGQCGPSHPGKAHRRPLQRLRPLCKGQGREQGFRGAAPRTAKRNPSRSDAAIRLCGRDHRRVCAGGAGFFLSRVGAGRCQCRPWQRPAPAAGHYRDYLRFGFRGKSGGGPALWRCRSPHSKGGGER